jgi:hypothetical protein
VAQTPDTDLDMERDMTGVAHLGPVDEARARIRAAHRLHTAAAAGQYDEHEAVDGAARLLDAALAWIDEAA